MVDAALVKEAADALNVTGLVPFPPSGQKYVAQGHLGTNDVVLKVVELSGSHRDQTLERARREVELLARIDHPNVVHVLTPLEELGGKPPTGVAWLEDYLDGEDLRARVGSPWPWVDTKAMAIDVARGLAAMHEERVVHRDLSAGNIRCTAAGSYVVMDPGLARHIERSTLTGVFQPGTPGFMSPEHVAMTRPTPASDVFGVGILMYLALTGSVPFPWTGDYDAYQVDLRDNQAPSIKATRPDLTDEQRAVVDMCLQRQSARRYLDGGELRSCARAPAVSPVLLHDSSRSGALTWAEGLLTARIVDGVILNPFSTPRSAIPRLGRTPGKDGAAECRARISAAGGEVFLDPTTHGVVAPSADMFSLYDTWEFWPGSPRGTTTRTALAAHVDQVLTRCRELDLRPIAPTLPLPGPTSPVADRALEMAELAVEARVDAYVSIVGSSTFWEGGSALDAYIGELVQLRPAGWTITVARDSLRYPWPSLDQQEVAGICRTVHSLSLRGAPVIASQGDLAALPAIAAGASHVGTGWDLRHRVCANDLFRQASGVRRASQRVTHRGLLASLKRDEAEAILAADAALSARTVAGALPPDHNAHWRHHISVLANRVEHVISAGDREARVRRLREMYLRAGTAFDTVTGLVGRLEAGRTQWIDPLASGLDAYAQGEGW